MHLLSLIYIALVVLPITFSGEVHYQPQQIHLSYGGEPTEMWVTWVTMDYTTSSTVLYGQQTLDRGVLGNATKFVDGGKLQRTMYIHRAKMDGLKPGQRYSYVVGGHNGWSEMFHFYAIKDGTTWSPYFMVYGDMGNDNARALPFLQLDAMSGKFDAVLHVGDFAYDLDTDNALVGDEFMRQIEVIAGYVPYMTCPGNHESAYKFSNYRYRFTMPPADGQGMYYSFNMGPAHIISINTEIYFYDSTTEAIKAQYDWLKKDLIQANHNRLQQPWIIVMGHKPMYCSNEDGGELCFNNSNKVRNGSSLFWPNLEDLFYNYGVDLQFYAHEHSYERLWPIYKSTVCNGSTEKPYTNPRAPVHIITGSAGDQEGQTKFIPRPSDWSAFRTDDYGYTRMRIPNATHLHLDEISTDKEGAVVDSVWIIKEKHGPGLYTCK
ncbi:hypothetical protein BaRGS_00038454 [Batillaria attramentaria]|uniref:Purple acid phosphatase n=1 Tax=Batillaria attramentaria TaxID=370345 RepID=A0ABD0J5R1_9CAEN